MQSAATTDSPYGPTLEPARPDEMPADDPRPTRQASTVPGWWIRKLPLLATGIYGIQLRPATVELRAVAQDST